MSTDVAENAIPSLPLSVLRELVTKYRISVKSADTRLDLIGKIKEYMEAEQIKLTISVQVVIPMGQGNKNVDPIKDEQDDSSDEDESSDENMSPKDGMNNMNGNGMNGGNNMNSMNGNSSHRAKQNKQNNSIVLTEPIENFESTEKEALMAEIKELTKQLTASEKHNGQLQEENKNLTKMVKYKDRVIRGLREDLQSIYDELEPFNSRKTTKEKITNSLRFHLGHEYPGPSRLAATAKEAATSSTAVAAKAVPNTVNSGTTSKAAGLFMGVNANNGANKNIVDGDSSSGSEGYVWTNGDVVKIINFADDETID